MCDILFWSWTKSFLCHAICRILWFVCVLGARRHNPFPAIPGNIPAPAAGSPAGERHLPLSSHQKHPVIQRHSGVTEICEQYIIGTRLAARCISQLEVVLVGREKYNINKIHLISPGSPRPYSAESWPKKTPNVTLFIGVMIIIKLFQICDCSSELIKNLNIGFIYLQLMYMFITLTCCLKSALN